MSLLQFAGRTALVTGATKGIGRGIALALAEQGADAVFSLGRCVDGLSSLAQEHCAIRPVAVDVSDPTALRNAVEECNNVDLLVNCAGITHLAPALCHSNVAAMSRIMSVNVTAPLVVAQSVARKLIEGGKSGSIVNVSSQASMRALKDHLVYCASKGALDQMTRSLALELGPYNIRVNAVNPTVIMTDMGRVAWGDPDKAKGMLDRLPIGRFGEVHEVVDAVLYLLSDKSSMITGVALPIDGGFTAA